MPNHRRNSTYQHIINILNDIPYPIFQHPHHGISLISCASRAAHAAIACKADNSGPLLPAGDRIMPDAPEQRHARLFEYIRQDNMMQVRALRRPSRRGLCAPEMRAFLATAERSFARPAAARPSALRQPLKPVATTNFSELSARDAGGFTLATFVKRCLSSFWSSPSAPDRK